MALADAFDMAYAITQDIRKMLTKEVPIMMITDTLSLFDVITKATSPTEKRLMTDISTVKEACKNNELSKLNFIRSEFDAADALKKQQSESIRHGILKKTSPDHPAEQRINRDRLCLCSFFQKSGNVAIRVGDTHSYHRWHIIATRVLNREAPLEYV